LFWKNDFKSSVSVTALVFLLKSGGQKSETDQEKSENILPVPKLPQN
jgi:hypothetical protein